MDREKRIEKQNELIQRIQAGERQLIPELWELLRPLTAKLLRRYAFMIADGNRLFDMDDLEQESFFALLDALQTYDPAQEWSFTTFYFHAIQNATRHLRGTVTHDALDISTSLNQPLDDEDGGELADVVPDAAAEDAFESAEISVFRHDLQMTFADIDRQLSDIQRQAVNAKYRRRMSAAAACEHLGISSGEYLGAIASAFLVYRRPANAARLKPYMNLYTGTGLTAFRQRGASSVELAVERSEMN